MPPLKFWHNFLLPAAIALGSLLFSLFILPLISGSVFNNLRVLDLGAGGAWNIWDAPHYLDIAQNFYQTEGVEANFIAFLPLFPLIISGLHFLIHANFLYLGFFVAISAAISTAIVFFHLIKLDHSARVALTAILTLFFFPTSFFLFIPYPESLFLLLSLSTFLALRKHKFLLGSILGLLATATKLAGLALVPAIFFELLFFSRTHFKPLLSTKNILLTGLPLLGFIFYLLVNLYVFGDPFYFTLTQKNNWNETFFPVIPGFKQALKFTAYPDFETSLYLGFAQITAFLLGTVATIYSYFKLRKSYFIYSLSLLFIYSSMSYWISLPRYVLSVFPIFIMLALALNNKITFSLYLLASITLLFIFGSIGLEHGKVF